MLGRTDETQLAELRLAIRRAYRVEESSCLRQRLQNARLEPRRERAVQEQARALAAAARTRAAQQIGVEAFLQEYDLSSREGVLLMCLAEALLRIPDAATADRLVRDRLAKGHWDEHLGASSSVLVNASTWGLLLTGRLLDSAGLAHGLAQQSLKQLVTRLGEPVVRLAVQAAMRILAEQFVTGRDIAEALRRAATRDDLRYSFDCLGEAARCGQDVDRYLAAYQAAIAAVGNSVRGGRGVFEQPGVSVKLSALHPRYEYAQRERVLRELVPRLRGLVEQAAALGIGLTIDAEEADRLELSLDVFEQLMRETQTGWEGLGLAVQAYQKRAWPLLLWLEKLAQLQRRCIPVRLVKGAYWDSEIKRSQERGLDGYPVFTRKAATDVSFLACAGFLLRRPERFYAQIASHNALTLAWVHELAAGCSYELQRLHGMAESLYAVLAEQLDQPPPVRVYARVGSHDELLPYLVRSMLENGANSSFINQLSDDSLQLDQLVENPCERVQRLDCRPHPRIPLPRDLYGEQRVNARGWDLTDPLVVTGLEQDLRQAWRESWHASSRVAGEDRDGAPRQLYNPADGTQLIGEVSEASATTVDHALAAAAAAAPEWDAMGGARRAECLLRAAELFEQEAPRLMACAVREGGRTIADALAELREAVDYCRYYASQARLEFDQPRVLPGPTGEQNELQLHGRGVFACISPWNFPLAIFVGQIAAALAAGNTVVAKPARQTPVTGYQAIRLLQRAGVPGEVLQFVTGGGAEIGARLWRHQALAGVALTGSTDTARVIQRALAERCGPIVPLIAETGGQNVMIADSSALPEQLVADVVQSAFNSAGQRCSALRVLFVQEDIAARVIGLLQGAMEEIRIGDPRLLTTDVGPLIDRQARRALQPHVERMQREARPLQCIRPDAGLAAGSFFPLHAFELDSLALLDKEVFGPVLHVIRYRGDRLDAVVDAVNGTGYGLTLGVHSRIEETWQRVRARARVGNLYINRNMIGAVVGVQPFGGEGLSGTGPKAGGPLYLYRCATERTCSANTAALGGNAGLLSLPDS